MFSVFGDTWKGLSVLDLFAGSGALGLECLSRGAAHATFVDRDARVVNALRRTMGVLGVGSLARIVPGDAARALQRLAREGRRFDAVWLDPPYESGVLETTLAALADGALLNDGAIVVAEHPTSAPQKPPGGILGERERRRYGDTSVTIYDCERETASAERQRPGEVA